MASAGWRKNDGVPMLASVAAIFRQMRPDLPMPVRMTRPLHSRSRRTAQSKRPSRRSTSARMAAASVSRTFRARARSAMDANLGAFRDRVDCQQPLQERLEAIQAQRVLSVAFGARRVVVYLDENSIDAGGDAGRAERFDV